MEDFVGLFVEKNKRTRGCFHDQAARGRDSGGLAASWRRLGLFSSSKQKPKGLFGCCSPRQHEKQEGVYGFDDGDGMVAVVLFKPKGGGIRWLRDRFGSSYRLLGVCFTEKIEEQRGGVKVVYKGCVWQPWDRPKPKIQGLFLRWVRGGAMQGGVGVITWCC